MISIQSLSLFVSVIEVSRVYGRSIVLNEILLMALHGHQIRLGRLTMVDSSSVIELRVILCAAASNSRASVTFRLETKGVLLVLVDSIVLTRIASAVSLVLTPV
jgi:hypothetical protein